MNVKVYNQDGVEVGSVELKPEIFEIEPNEAIVHQYIVNFQAMQRQGNASTRTRKDISGGGKKPWRQKGTGRARAGSIRSPLWHGGGTVFGPHPRWYGSKFPRKMKRLALKSVLSDKARSEKIKVLEAIKLEEIKTKAVLNILAKLNLADKKCLILDEGKNEMMVLSCRNLKKVKYGRAAKVNGYDMLNADYILFTKAGLDKAQEVF
ncbi:MAG: 50S ribosomal protein L4 [candidate division Zixibacteria bacterium]|nr:50S ribosomal protein L4 [candidate division Zixibacteria bacterium]